MGLKLLHFSLFRATATNRLTLGAKYPTPRSDSGVIEWTVVKKKYTERYEGGPKNGEASRGFEWGAGPVGAIYDEGGSSIDNIASSLCWSVASSIERSNEVERSRSDRPGGGSISSKDSGEARNQNEETWEAGEGQ